MPSSISRLTRIEFLNENDKNRELTNETIEFKLIIRIMKKRQNYVYDT